MTRLVRLVDTSAFTSPSPDPSGIVYLSNSNTLLISDAEVELTPVFQGNNTFETTLDGVAVTFGNVLNFSAEPTGLAYNPGDRTLFISDDANGSRRITRIRTGNDNIFGTSDDVLVSRFRSLSFNNVNDAEDVTFDPNSGNLWIANGLSDTIYQVTTSGSLMGSFSSSDFGLFDPEGLVVNTQSNNLLIVGDPADFVFEVTKTGKLVQKIYIGDVNPVKPAGIAIAPTSDGSSIQSFYIVDRGIDDRVDPNENDGRLYEFTLENSIYAVSDNDNINLNGLTVADEDVVVYNSRTGLWTTYFDGSNVGLANNRVDALHVEADGSILLSLNTDTNLDTLGFVDDADILRFTPSSTGNSTAGTFTRYFDGSDVGLNTNTEDVDSLAIAPNGDILISTNGSYSVPGVAGSDRDILRFSATSLGENTAGSFALYFDGADVGLHNNEGEDIKGLSVFNDSELVLSTQGNYDVTGLTGGGGDLISFSANSLGSNTSGNFSLFSDDVVNGFGNNPIGDFSIA